MGSVELHIKLFYSVILFDVCFVVSFLLVSTFDVFCCSFCFVDMFDVHSMFDSDVTCFRYSVASILLNQCGGVNALHYRRRVRVGVCHLAA